MIPNPRPAVAIPSAGPRWSGHHPKTPPTFCSKWSRFASRASILKNRTLSPGLAAVDCARSIVEMNILMAKS
jgi:hypothetical protein